MMGGGEADAGNMSNYDPNLGLGAAGYEKATTAHAATILGHLKTVGMTPQSPGAKQVADGIHKAAMDRLFNAPKQSPGPMQSISGIGEVNPGSGTLGSGTGSNANSTPMGTSNGYMIPH